MTIVDRMTTDQVTHLQVTRRRGAGPSNVVCTVRVPVDTEAILRVRHELAADLAVREVPQQVVDDAQLVVSELLTNAFRHARPLVDGTVRVRWKVRPESLEVEVTDGGSHTVPHAVPPGPWRDEGRGLRVVRSLAHEWGVTHDRTGQVVWATLGGPSRRRVN